MMKKLFLAILLMLMGSPAWAGDFWFTFPNVAQQAQTNRPFYLYPEIVTQGTRDRLVRRTDANGGVGVTNIFGGRYRGELVGVYAVTTNWYSFPETNGFDYATNYILNPLLYAGISVYSTTSADARFYPLRNNPSNYLTSAGGIGGALTNNEARATSLTNQANALAGTLSSTNLSQTYTVVAAQGVDSSGSITGATVTANSEMYVQGAALFKGGLHVANGNASGIFVGKGTGLTNSSGYAFADKALTNNHSLPITFGSTITGNGIGLTNLATTNVLAFGFTIPDRTQVIMANSPTNSMNGTWREDQSRRDGLNYYVWTNSGWSAGNGIGLDTQNLLDITNGAGNVALMTLSAFGESGAGNWVDTSFNPFTPEMTSLYVANVGPLSNPLTVSNIVNETELLLTNLVTHGLTVTNKAVDSFVVDKSRDFQVFGNLEVVSKANAKNQPDPFGMFTSPYTDGDSGTPTMGFAFQKRSEFEDGGYQNEYAMAAGRNSSLGTQNLTLNVKNRYTFNGGWEGSGLVGWFELDFNDNAVLMVHANGGMSLDLPSSGNHPNTDYGSLANALRSGPGTNSFSVRSNIISRYGDLIATNGALRQVNVTAPNAVTVGTTAPDKWFIIKDAAGVSYKVPAWSEH